MYWGPASEPAATRGQVARRIRDTLNLIALSHTEDVTYDLYFTSLRATLARSSGFHPHDVSPPLDLSTGTGPTEDNAFSKPVVHLVLDPPNRLATKRNRGRKRARPDSLVNG